MLGAQEKAHRSGLPRRDGHRSHGIDADTPQSFQCSPITSGRRVRIARGAERHAGIVPGRQRFHAGFKARLALGSDARAPLSSVPAEPERVQILPPDSPPLGWRVRMQDTVPE